MTTFLSTLFYILLFILCLSILIMVHEAGHLLAAKAFKVYCFEYSIGFGPKLFSKKREKGETYFSLRAIPLGGFVSMYGEAESVPEGIGPIDEKRSLEHINKWKKAIVLVAGVTMNVVLAILIFFVAETCCPQFSYSAARMQVSENSIAYNAGIRANDIVYLEEYDNNYFVVDREAKIDEDDITIAACLTRQMSSSSDLDWDNHLFFVTYGESELVIDAEHQVLPSMVVDKHISFHIKVLNEDETVKSNYTLTLASKKHINTYVFDSTGLQITRRSYHNSFGYAFKKTFDDFGQSSTAIIRGLGSLFTGGAKDMGGIIAIGFTSTSILKNFGIYSFLLMWGMISVNLAIVNLLPFPGLDGWQLLVTMIEGISKKKIPDKVKGIVSLVGIGLLFVLMGALIIKDLIMFVF